MIHSVIICALNRPSELVRSLKVHFNRQLTQVVSLVLQSSIRPSTNRRKLLSQKYIHLSALGPLVHAIFSKHLNWTSYSVGRMLMRSYVSCTVATLRFTLFSWWTYRRASSACWILFRYERTTLHFIEISQEGDLCLSTNFQVFVEALDRAFENVCELDLVFHFDEVRYRVVVLSPSGSWLPRDFLDR